MCIRDRYQRRVHGIMELADSRVVKTIRHLRSLKDEEDVQVKRMTSEELYNGTTNKKNTRTPHQGFRRTMATPTNGNARHKSSNYVTPAQAEVLINVYQDKIINIMKKSTMIYGILQKYEMNVGAVINLLFSDKLFKTVVLSQPESVMNNSKKLEQFLAARIERKLNELEIQSLINKKLKEIFERMEARISYLNQLKGQ
eukprot:TRINITY_DN10736_c0_g5_i2.p1 TRINITY_DN10736_c0_g5~~TRINITY_DN10736_c0_g5_i2.p1  ORF type:complete len:199 (+),score=60.10 TRINITY_DN10736_c0_g5_i2:77-673(+)